MESTTTSSEFDEAAFVQLTAHRGVALFALASHLSHRPMGTDLITRPLLGAILSESAQLEELLDSYGARQNRRWHKLRHLVALAKLFAAAGYKLLHIQHSITNYRLLQIDGDFEEDTRNTTLFTSDTMLNICAQLVREASTLGLSVTDKYYPLDAFDEDLPVWRLPNDRESRDEGSVKEIIAHLATAFLNLAAESGILHVYTKCNPEDYMLCVPDPVSEEELRQLEHKFHNLQSLYDTFVSDTSTEKLDNDLLVLRGHVSVIYHLLEVATYFCHDYERHLMARGSDTFAISRPLVDPKTLLLHLIDYSLAYSSRYLETARELCQEMLRRYAEIGSITVHAPRYRGFHVRPSTLVAKIAHHYGSDVQMLLDGEEYDASTPLDLFRANEKINAMKRRKLAHYVTHMGLGIAPNLELNMIDAARQIVASLAAMGKLVIYERPLPFEEITPSDGEALSQFALDEITRMMAMGKLDIESDFEVTFHGDIRVLEDLKLLAENGYGEDNFGNNISLPQELSYLRR